MAHDSSADLADWITKHWSPTLTVREWWRLLADERLVAPSWPAPYGRGLGAGASRALHAQLASAGVLGPPTGAVGMMLAGPTLLAHATPEQLDAHLPPLLRGEESWCQLFSEPNAGSDLPSLATTAVSDGDGWVVDGQKVWNSAADIADRGLLLARTDPDRPKREGLSYFVIDMAQPSIDVRPLRQMNGDAQFCEVFLTGARLEATDLIGALGDGWRVARTTLALERAMAASRPPKGSLLVASGRKARNLDRTVGEVIDELRSQRSAPFAGHAVPARRLIALAGERGAAADPAIRQGLARYYTLTELNRFTQLRTASAARAGQAPGPEASISKLAIGQVCDLSSELSFAILGPNGMLAGPDAPYEGSLQDVALAAPGVHIGGGTDQIQRTTIAERSLGLPREPDPDHDQPWRKAKR